MADWREAIAAATAMAAAARTRLQGSGSSGFRGFGSRGVLGFQVAVSLGSWLLGFLGLGGPGARVFSSVCSSSSMMFIQLCVSMSG